jgi:hypothetical protein
MKNGNGSHYHIHWTGKTLDWERFDTSAEAEASARELMLPGETFTIEEHGESCPQCRSLLRKIPVRDSSGEASA